MTDLRKAAEMALGAFETYLQFSTEEMLFHRIAKARAEALRQALSNEFNPDWNQVEALQESLREHMAEIQRLRQALAQPNSTCNGMPAYEGSLSKSQALAQPEQEPECVGVIGNWGRIEWREDVFPQLGDRLYSASPKREWVGLTDEDISNADCVSLDYNLKGEYGVIESTVLEFARAIEAKLKEKNSV